ncbi:MAG: site-specific integrase, partial [Pyrinomonadaceae bacterium]
MSLYKQGEIWYIYLVHNGRRIRRTARTRNKREAQQIHDELKARLWKEHPPGRETLNDAFALWLSQKPRTANEKRAIKAFRKLYRNRSISEVSNDSIARALAGKSPGTYNRYISIVGAALNAMNANAVKLHRKPVPPGRVRFLTQVEWLRLDRELPKHLKAMARFTLATGLRAANIRELTWGHVDMEKRLAWISAERAKGKKAIGVPLSDAAMEVLRGELGQHETHVFTYRGEPIRGQIKGAWKEGLARAKIKSFRWHDLRHTWASWHI